MALKARYRSNAWERLLRLRRQRRYQNVATLGLVVLGPLLALATFLVLGPLGQGGTSMALRLVLLADLVYVLLLAALVLQRVLTILAQRRQQSAGSRLHLRLTGVFALMAFLPTVTVAVFAMLTINIGLETWFSKRVQSVVGASLAAAQSYEAEQSKDLREDAGLLAGFIEERHRDFPINEDGDLRLVLTEGQGLIQRGLKEAFVLDGAGNIRARGARSYLFDLEVPKPSDFDAAHSQGTALISDWPNDEYRALVKLRGLGERFLYISRTVDGDLLALLDETQETARFYQQQESERGRRLADFALLYLGFAVLLILAAVLLGLWFAERLSRPVGRLAGAAQQVGAGDLDVQVIEEEGDDEIAMLSQYFNQMTRQLKGQREALLDNTRQIERRRRLFDSVLASVTSGVVGVDDGGRVAFVNRSAERLLDWHEQQTSLALSVAVPEFAPVFDKLQNGPHETLQEEVRVTRNGRLENLLVRMAKRRRHDGTLEGYVVAFDDVTNLVAAQRMAAWGDVARRIAHEIKNPLTPIQLSAERIRRKFGAQLDAENADSLQQLTEVIVRQTNDLRRIVDEFSKFARMPEPDRRSHSLAKLVRDAVVLQRAGQPDVEIALELPDDALMAQLDDTMIGQALTNLIKNAGEAIETRVKSGVPAGFQGVIRLQVAQGDGQAVIQIMDNGIGLPEDRARLFEPYVTSRAEGTGLGLPIVKKIIEEHGGRLDLETAPAFAPDGHQGAMAVIVLPLATLDATNDAPTQRGQDE